MKGKFADTQEIAPQVEGGCDYSAKGVVLVRGKLSKLVWRKGGGVWDGIGFPRRYAPCSLQVIYLESKRIANTQYIFEGGRLSQKRIASSIGQIRTAMGLPDLGVEHIDPKKTFVVD